MSSQEKCDAMPAVSVVMPAYNAEKYIEEAIYSVRSQTFRDWELIVVDDCSTDGTPEIVARLAREDGRIHLYRSDRNSGAAATRNRGLSLCRGRYVALLDSDDRWMPEKLERQVRLAEETGAEVIYCSYGIIDENGKKICDDFIVPERTDLESSLARMVISCSTALLSARICREYRFDPSYYHEDLVFWFRLLLDGNEARGVPAVMAEYRVMEGTRASNKLRNAIFRWQIYRGFLGFSFFKSLRLLAEYAILGVKKYRRNGSAT